LVSLGIEPVAGLLGLHRGDELVLRPADGGLRASAPRSSASKLIVFGERAVDGV
jgi:hypothetical protein